MTDTARDILLGHIAGAHGIRGEVLIKSYTDVPEDIATYGPLHDPGSSRTFAIAVVRSSSKGLIARIDGVTDRTAAERLKGTKLCVDRSQLPALDTDEIYHADLIGLRAEDEAGQPIGEIVGVHNFGAGDILEVRLSGKKKTELIPYNETFVPQVDLEARRVVVVIPAAEGDDEPDDKP